MNKLIKQLGYLVLVIVSIITVKVGLSNKQEDKAADFPHNVAIENNGSVFRGGAFS
ncbi:hypothetical protein [Xylocopilactobacillus apis]|uniref:Phr family secreted Rap phosphatase inhibitor n=1 Tax=Xylocopilactobacillus apis TaxID=2932183 RepID=A0AAU9DPZ4_9LACO|nr:hypothetical protein [Xylocopilactobacillus apis]BDR57158.1 hypothetical protein KIMC2_17200 [Xylocopilactobacillus apis]